VQSFTTIDRGLMMIKLVSKIVSPYFVFSIVLAVSGCGDAGNRVIHVREAQVPEKSPEELQREAESALPSVWEIPITGDRLVELDLVREFASVVVLA
jgi:hypothetical protein